MRAGLTAAFGALVLILAGCGGASGSQRAAASLDGNAANLVPPDAAAFVAIDTDLSSPQWQRVDTLTRAFPIRGKVFQQLNDIAAALGPETDVAVIGQAPVVFTRSKDEPKLKALVAKLSAPQDQYSIEDIGGWSVIARAPSAIDAVRGAQSGRSLADAPAFKAAWSSVAGDGLARIYVNGRPVTPTGVERAHWLAAVVHADTDALRADAVVQPARTLPSLAPSSLIGDVPSGASFAIAFRETGDLLQTLGPMKLPAGLSVKALAPLLSGGGVAYVRAHGLIPEFAIELASKDPQAALAQARALLRAAAAKLETLQLSAQLSNGKLVISDSPVAVSALRSRPKLVDDAAYKDALAKAGVPAHPSFIAYADVAGLAPFVPVLVQAVTGKAPSPDLAPNLAHVGTVVVWGTRNGGRAELHAWTQPR